MKEQLFYSIGEVCSQLKLPQYQLRNWEKYFPFLQPKRDSGGRRIYTSAQIELLRQIKSLHEQGYRVDAMRRLLYRKHPNSKKSYQVYDHQVLEELKRIRKNLIEIAHQLK